MLFRIHISLFPCILIVRICEMLENQNEVFFLQMIVFYYVGDDLMRQTSQPHIITYHHIFIESKIPLATHIHILHISYEVCW